MAHSISVYPLKTRISFGYHVLDHLTADGTRLTRREIAVVTFLEVYANLSWRFIPN